MSQEPCAIVAGKCYSMTEVVAAYLYAEMEVESSSNQRQVAWVQRYDDADAARMSTERQRSDERYFDAKKRCGVLKRALWELTHRGGQQKTNKVFGAAYTLYGSLIRRDAADVLFEWSEE